MLFLSGVLKKYLVKWTKILNDRELSGNIYLISSKKEWGIKNAEEEDNEQMSSSSEEIENDDDKELRYHMYFHHWPQSVIQLQPQQNNDRLWRMRFRKLLPPVQLNQNKELKWYDPIRVGITLQKLREKTRDKRKEIHYIFHWFS